MCTVDDNYLNKCAQTIIMYHEVIERKGNKYHYLTENIRTGEKWKKVRVYLGKGKKTDKEIKKLTKKNKKKLQNKVNNFLESSDPLMGILKEKELEKLEKIKKEYSKYLKKLGKAGWEKYYEWFLTKFTYNTNAIEGSTLNLIETKLVLFENTTPKGKELWEIDWVKNHKDAFDYMINRKGDLTRKFILNIHKKLMHNILKEQAGVFRDVQVFIAGSKIIPPKPNKINEEFTKLMRWYGYNKDKYHPVVVAAYFHSVFESIHPFIDGNGRTGRLILNFMLKEKGYPMIDIKNRDKTRYFSALNKANEGNLKSLVKLIAKYIKEIEYI